MRLLNKLKIFFRLEKEEVIDGIKEYGLVTLVLISIPFTGKSFLDVGFTLFLLGWFMLCGIALVGVILFLLGRWIYSNWQMAERELTQLEDKKKIKK